MEKKSVAFYRYCSDMANGTLSYFDPDEIEDAVCDLIDLNMMNDALRLVRHGLSLHPGNETIEYWAIWIYLHDHRIDEAEELFSKYRDNTASGALRLKFSLLVLRGHPKLALQDFQKALTEGKVQTSEWINTIEEMYETLPNEVLTPFLHEAANWIEHDAETISRIATLLIEAGEYAEAARHLERALDINAYDIYSWQDLARCYMILHELGKCQEACDYGLAIEGGNPLLSFIKGYLLFDRGEYADCIPFLITARKFAEGKVGVRNLNMSDDEIQQQINVTYELLGSAYMETEQNKKAKECFDILIERNPKNVQSYIHQASMLLLEGDLNSALNYVEQARHIKPHEEAICSLRISILSTMRKFEETREALEEAIDLFPKQKNFLAAYAELLRQTGKEKQADEAYRRLLNMPIKEPIYKRMLQDYFTSIGDNEALSKLSSTKGKDSNRKTSKGTVKKTTSKTPRTNKERKNKQGSQGDLQS